MDSTQLSVSDGDGKDIENVQSLVLLCAQRETEIKRLKETVKSQGERISDLEKYQTQNDVKSLADTKKVAIPEVPKDQKNAPEQEVVATCISRNLGALSQSSNEISRRKSEGIPLKNKIPAPESRGEPSNSDEKDGSGRISGDEDGFRHTTKERKEIKRGKLPLRAATGHTDVTGTSTGSHGISASLQGQNAPYLIYVGRLNPHTTTEQLREHMHAVGITDIADVLELNQKSNVQKSFCVSVNGANSKDRAFEANLWPVGVIVRPFRPSKPRRRFNYYQRGSSGFSRVQPPRNQGKQFHFHDRSSDYFDNDNKYHGRYDNERSRFDDYGRRW